MAEVSNPDYYKGQFPSPIMPKRVMDLPATGKAVADAIYQTSIYGTNSYYYIRNNIMAENRVFAAGKQPFQTYLDLLGVDGRTSYMNLDYHPRPIAPKFRDIMVNDIMQRMESIDCTGLSLAIQQRKDTKKAEMAFKMEHGDFIQTAEQTAGMKFSQPTDFVPETEDELELWSQLNDKEKEELLMEYGIDFILEKNNQKALKKEIAEDLVDTGLACEYTYLNGSKMIRTKRIRPEYLVYGTTNTLNFRNVAYRGHLERISILDVRCMYPNYPEKELYQLAYQFKGLYGNPDGLVDFIADYEISYTRPYDSYLIDVLFFEYNVIKTIDYVKGVDKNNNKIFDLNKKTDGKNPNKQGYNIKIPTIYKGAWLIGASDMLEWGEMQNLIRNNEDIEDVRSSYAIYMLNNNGDMLPVSPMNAIRSSIIQMDLAILKMQHVIATTPPNGLKMDIDAITELDLGTGLKKVGPMKLKEIWQQTGDSYYSSSKISGDSANRSPIEQNINELGTKIQEYIGVYNFELNCIRDYIGVNEVKDGSGVNPRLGLGVMEGQVAASNLATAHIYGGYISILTDTAKSVGIMLWDLLNTDTTNEVYIRLLGKQNVDFIKYSQDITKSNYTTKISVNMDNGAMAWLDELCITAVQQKQMLPDDALMVKKYSKFSFDYAVRYLTFVQKKRAQQAQREQMQLAQQQQTATAQLSEQQMQAKQSDEANKDKRSLLINQNKTQGEHMLKYQDLINLALIEQMKTGAPLHPYVQNLMDNQNSLQLIQQQSQIESMENELQIHDLEVTQLQAQQQQQSVEQPQGEQQELPQQEAA